MLYLIIGMVTALILLTENGIKTSLLNMACINLLKCNKNNEYKTDKDIQDAKDGGYNIADNILSKYGKYSLAVVFLIIVITWPLILAIMLFTISCYLYLRNK